MKLLKDILIKTVAAVIISLILVGVFGHLLTVPGEGMGRPEIVLVDTDLQGYIITVRNKGTGIIKPSALKIYCNEKPIELPCEIEAGLSVDIQLGEALPQSVVQMEFNGETQSVVLPDMLPGTVYKKNNESWGFSADIAQNGFADDLLSLLAPQDAKVIINEVMPRDANGNSWIELYNRSDKNIDLSDYSLHNNLERAGEKLSGSIAPNGYTVISLGETGSVNISVGDSLYLVSDNKFSSYVKINPCSVPYVSCSANGFGCRYHTVPTPGAENSDAVDATDVTAGRCEIYINELSVINNLSIAPLTARRMAWAELYNQGPNDINLSGMFLSDDADDLFKWALPAQTVKAGEYAMVFFCGGDAEKNTLMAPFALDKNTKAIYLTDIKSLKCQMISTQNAKENLSVDGDGKQLDFISPCGQNDIKPDNRLHLKINEVSSVHTAKSNTEDWVEIYNPTDKQIDLSGVYLTDSKKEPTKYALSGNIPAKGYKVIKDSGISIAAEGEQIYLYYGGYFTDVFNVPKLLPQYTAGRVSQGIKIGGTDNLSTQYGVYLMPATSGKKNSEDILMGYAEAPIFSQEGGYYQNGTVLSISAQDGADIYYTLDGSTPTEKSARYSGQITITKTTVVRAVCIKKGYAASAETVGTFRTGEDNHTIPVVCLSINKADLDYVVASKDRLDLRERAGYVEYYNENGVLQTAFPAGLSIGGNGTRHYAQRTFNLHLRGAYGQSSVVYPFFANNDSIIEYSSLSLRNCGQDTYYTRLRDAYISMAADGMNANNAKTYFAVVYLNGKYHGLYEFKENQNEDYLASHTGCDRDTVQLVRNNTNVYNKVGKNTDIKNLIKFALETDCADEAVYQEFLTYVDEDAYTDYLIAVGFFVLSDVYNQKCMRSMDGVAKWQPILYDLDSGLGSNTYKRKILSQFFSDKGVFTASGMKMETVVYNAFFENAGWREKFVQRYAYLLNTSLSTESLLALFDRMVDTIAPEMERHCKRWNTPSNVETWESNVEAMRNAIIKRREHALMEIKDLFRLSDEKMAQLFPNDYN